MRTCQSCGKENPDWIRISAAAASTCAGSRRATSQAITPAQKAAEAKAAGGRRPRSRRPQVARTSRAHRARRRQRATATATPPPRPRRCRRAPPEPQSVGAPGRQDDDPRRRARCRRASAAAGDRDEAEPATIVLRLADGEPAKGEVLHLAVEPGQRERILALVRNQSGIVDNYDLRVEGMPDDWWSIHPGTVYLVPFGSGGTVRAGGRGPPAPAARRRRPRRASGS